MRPPETHVLDRKPSLARRRARASLLHHHTAHAAQGAAMYVNLLGGQTVPWQFEFLRTSEQRAVFDHRALSIASISCALSVSCIK